MKKPHTKAKLLAVGDVIKTNPKDGYWGCAVVLNARGKTEQFNPFCHIGITPVIFRHNYDWNELSGLPLSILEFDREIRIIPGIYPTRHEICIGIYDARPHPDFHVIGQVDPIGIFSGRLGFEPGDGTKDKWPLCGRISKNLGYEAVLVWRSIHDRPKWQEEVEASRESGVRPEWR